MNTVVCDKDHCKCNENVLDSLLFLLVSFHTGVKNCVVLSQEVVHYNTEDYLQNFELFFFFFIQFKAFLLCLARVRRLVLVNRGIFPGGDFLFSTKLVLEFLLSLFLFFFIHVKMDYAIIVDNMYSLISSKMPLLGLILWQIFEIYDWEG